MFKPFQYIALFSLLSACSSYAGPWPNLADPLPTGPQRSSIEGTPAAKITRATAADSSPIAMNEARLEFETLITAIESEWVNYLETRQKYDADSDAETKDISWSGAQLTLSRVSLEIGRLQDLVIRPLVEKDADALALAEAMVAQLLSQEKKLAAARADLAALQP